MLTNKKIVLTGANSGIGLEILKLLVQGGNKVFVVDKNIDKVSTFDKESVIPYQCDISSKEAVDAYFDEAVKALGSIDIFFANAGYPYYEELNYADWDRVETMFKTNVFSPIYSYQKYVRYLDGKPGHYGITVSAIGLMAMPGYTIYSSSKFAMNGFQEALRLEMPKNVKLTCLYPIATETNFFKTANALKFKKPFPVQKPEIVAKKLVKGLEKGKKKVNPSALFVTIIFLLKFLPFIRTIYWKMETKKFNEFKKYRDIESKEKN